MAVPANEGQQRAGKAFAISLMTGIMYEKIKMGACVKPQIEIPETVMKHPASPSVKAWAAMVLGVALLGVGDGIVLIAAEFVPYPVEWPREVRSPADLSFLLDAPAGKHGFVRAEGGHLSFPDGRRLRIWGINITMAAAFPEPEGAPILAAHLARLGLNCIRFHFLDIPAPRGLLAAGRDDTRALDPSRLDRLDRFIAELKLRGIYTNLNLNVGRRYLPGDGVRDAELLGVAKGITYYDERLIELQKEYARALLAHKNPYTGIEYRDDPAVAMVELVNENSLLESWFSGRLLGNCTQKPSDVWSDIPPSYAEALTKKYSAWLERRLSPAELDKLRAEAGVSGGAPVARLRPEEFPRASKERFHLEASFYMELEREYFREMARFLREELKVKCPIAGSSDHNHYRSGYPHTAGLATLDVVDGHVYWQHPRYLRDPKGRTAGFDIPNTPMVDDPQGSTVVQLARTPVAGKPYTVSEFNHPFPNEYACEGLPILAAYAAFQDWDGIFPYTLAHADVLALKLAVAGHFDYATDPTKIPQLAAGALIFLRPDVRPAERTVDRSYALDQVIESIRLPVSERPLYTPGMPRDLPLRHGVRVGSFGGPPAGAFEGETGGPLRSDTGELSWHAGAPRSGCVTVDAERAQALIGFCSAARTRHLSVESLSSEFCALTLGSLDGRPIGRSEKLLFTMAARSANTGMRWNEKRTSLESWGTEPACIEVVTGKLILRGLEGAKGVEATALDGAGRPLGDPIPAEPAPGPASGSAGQGWALPLGRPPATWHVVVVRR